MKKIPTWLLAILAIVILGSVGNHKVGDEAKAEKPPVQKCDDSTDKKNQWAHFVFRLKEEKILSRVSTEGVIAKAFVLPKYYRLTFEEKKAFTSVAHAFAFGCKTDTLHLYDAQTNAKIGTYNEWGLNLNKTGMK